MKAKTLRGVRTTFRALRNRNFRLFFAGQLISQAGTWLTTIALTLLVLQLTHSEDRIPPPRNNTVSTNWEASAARLLINPEPASSEPQ